MARMTTWDKSPAIFSAVSRSGLEAKTAKLLSRVKGSIVETPDTRPLVTPRAEALDGANKTNTWSRKSIAFADCKVRMSQSLAWADFDCKHKRDIIYL